MSRRLTILLIAALLAVGCSGRPRPVAHEGMKRLPGGSFAMGSSDPNTFPNERPAHQVTVGAFWIDEHPVTNAQFRQFVESTNYKTTAERPVNWEELKQQLPPGTPKPN